MMVFDPIEQAGLRESVASLASHLDDRRKWRRIVRGAIV
jgi:hypothetical protein